MNPAGTEGDRPGYPDLPTPLGARSPSHRAPTPAPAVLSAGPDAESLLRAFARRWPLVVLGGVAVGLGAGAGAFFLVPPPRYTVKAMFHVASTPARIIFQTSESVPDYRSYQKTQLTLAKSRRVLTAALRQPELAGLSAVPADGDPASWLDREVKVDFPGGAEIMTIAMTAADPKAATRLVNSVSDAYLKQIVEEERRDRVSRYDSLKTLFNKLQDELREKRKTYRVSVEDVGVTDKLSIAARQQSATQNLGLLQVELAQLQAEIRQMRRKAKMAALTPGDAGEPDPSSEAAADDAVARDIHLGDLKRAAAGLKAKAAEINRLSRDPSDPAVRKASERWRAAEAATRDRVDEVRAEAARLAGRDAKARGDGRQAEADQALAILTEQEKALQDQVKALDGDLKSGNVKALDMNWLDDEIALTAQAARTVGFEVEALNVELAAQSRIRLIERAEAPSLSDPMRRYKVSGAAGLAGLALFAGGIVLLEARARRVGSTEEVSRGLGIRLIGSIPARPRGRQPGKANDAWQRMLIESVDAARTMILHASRIENLAVIMVGSAVKGEGKTTLSCLLSASLQRAGKRTLLLDGDLRCPAIHRLIDVTPGAGLSEVLRGEVLLDEAIVPSAGPGVDFLPAGKVDGDALRGLADGRLAGVFAELRGRYEQIVVDSAPILYVPDGSIIAQHVDAVVMSVLRDVSQAPKVYTAHERLADLGVRVLGAVVGGTRGEESRGYAYQYAKGSIEGRS